MGVFRFNIVKHLGTIAEYEDTKGNKMTKEVNLVSWNGRPPKIDIREWDENHEHMTKGVTFAEQEAEQVCMILHNYLAERSK